MVDVGIRKRVLDRGVLRIQFRRYVRFRDAGEVVREVVPLEAERADPD